MLNSLCLLNTLKLQQFDLIKKIPCHETKLSAQIGFGIYFINEKYLSCYLSEDPVFYFLF